MVAFALRYRHVFILLCMMLLVACTDRNACLTPKTVALRAGFYVKPTDSVSKDTLLENANVIFATPTSFFGFNLKQSSRFQSSLSATADSAVIYFQSDSTNLDPSTLDTINVYYSSKLNFVSTACGYEYYHTLSKVNSTHQIIDTITISFAEINGDANKEHMAIFLKK
jgi:hypothetical protein